MDQARFVEITEVVEGVTDNDLVHKGTHLPLWSIALSALISLLLSLINIGSSVAFNAIVSLTIACFLGLLCHSHRSSGMEKSNTPCISPRTLEHGTIWPCRQHYLLVLACHHMGVHFLPYRHSCDSIDDELELYLVGRIHDSWVGLVLHLAAQGLCRTQSSGWHNESALENFAITETVRYCWCMESFRKRRLQIGYFVSIQYRVGVVSAGG